MACQRWRQGTTDPRSSRLSGQLIGQLIRCIQALCGLAAHYSQINCRPGVDHNMVETIPSQCTQDGRVVRIAAQSSLSVATQQAQSAAPGRQQRTRARRPIEQDALGVLEVHLAHDVGGRGA